MVLFQLVTVMAIQTLAFTMRKLMPRANPLTYMDSTMVVAFVRTASITRGALTVTSVRTLSIVHAEGTGTKPMFANVCLNYVIKIHYQQ
jgi:hypothetical protein